MALDHTRQYWALAMHHGRSNIAPGGTTDTPRFSATVPHERCFEYAGRWIILLLNFYFVYKKTQIGKLEILLLGTPSVLKQLIKTLLCKHFVCFIDKERSVSKTSEFATNCNERLHMITKPLIAYILSNPHRNGHVI